MSNAPLFPLPSCYGAPSIDDDIFEKTLPQLPLATLWSFFNKLLRPEAPAYRDEGLYRQLLQRMGWHKLLRNEPLSGLAMEYLAKRMLYAWAKQSVINPIDRRLHLIYCLEQYTQFEPDALAPTIDLKSISEPELLSQFEGFCEHLGEERSSHLLTSLVFPWPWTSIVQQFNAAPDATFAYLQRFATLAQWMSEQSQLQSPLSLLLPQVLAWEKGAFRDLTQDLSVVSPIQCLVLVEGATEALILPAACRALGYQPVKEGVAFEPVGGKNPMLARYVEASEDYRFPICIVLDADAAAFTEDFEFYRRPQDRLFILKEGEIEDLYAPELILKTLDADYQPSETIGVDVLEKPRQTGRVKQFQALWHQYGLGHFDKIEFAQNVSSRLQSAADVSEPMRALIEAIWHVKASV